MLVCEVQKDHLGVRHRLRKGMVLAGDEFTPDEVAMLMSLGVVSLDEIDEEADPDVAFSIRRGEVNV
jgi:hypothetical protein